MTAENRSTIKGHFESDDVPTESNYGDLIDSCVFREEFFLESIGYTEGTNPKAVTAGSNNKIGGFTVRNYDDSEADFQLLGAYGTSAESYVMIGGGYATGTNAATLIQVTLADSVAGGNGVNVLQIDSTDSGDETCLLLNVNGTLKRVSFGAADSESSGYRTLRIAN